MDHGVLAAHLVGGYGKVFTKILGVADNVEVLAGGLDHDDVGTLVDVSNDGSTGKAATAVGQLVTLAVAEARGGAGSVAEGPVQTARELGGIRHEKCVVSDPFLDQLELDGADTAIVHVRRRDAVGTGTGVGDGDVRYAVNRQLVIEATVVSQNATVSMRRVLAQANIANDEELGKALTDGADASHDRALRVVG